MLRSLRTFLVCFVLLIFSGCKSSIETHAIGDSTVTTFKSVWYRHDDFRTGYWAWQDKGALVLNDDSIEFIGEKYQITIKDIIDISYGKLTKTLSTDPSKWVKITYEDTGGNRNMALFAESGSLGWSGVRGGTQIIYDTIKQKYVK